MKALFLILVLSSSYTFGKDLSPFDKDLEEMLYTTGVFQFKEDIKKIKKHDSIEQITELDYDLKWYFKHISYWYFFDADNYYSEFRHKIKMNFSRKEIQEINDVFSNPFLAKLLKAAVTKRDVFTFHNNVLNAAAKYPELVKSRYAVINNVFIMFGANMQIEQIRGRLEEVVGSGKTLMTVLTTSSKDKIFIDPKALKGRLDGAEDYMVMAFANDLKEFRHFELREFLRRMKKSKVSQKYIQLLMNYHYFYLVKYIVKIEQDKSAQYKALSVEVK